MSKSMGTCAVNSHLGANAHSRDHITDLTNDMPGKQPSAVVFEHGVNNTIESHADAKRNKYLKTSA